MPSRRCCCGGGCTCENCLNNIGPCCFAVSVGDDSYIVIWTEACTWENTSISISISSTAISITIGEEAYSVAWNSGDDCKTIANLEVPNIDGISTSAILSAGGSDCYHCWCYCDQCAEVYDGKNAACCWLVYIGSKIVKLGRDTEADGHAGCVWSGSYCDNGLVEVSLTLSTILATLQIGNDTYTQEFENYPACCENLSIGAYTLIASAEEDCAAIDYECVQATISGVDNACGCSYCKELNGTFSLTWTGGNFDGTICKQAAPYYKCEPAWSNLSVATARTGLGTTATVRLYTTGIGGYDVTWSGSNLAALPFVSGGGTFCDFSNSFVSLAFGPQCAPCGESTSCIEEDCSFYPCKDGSKPNYYQVTIPKESWPTICGVTEDQVFLLPVQWWEFEEGSCQLSAIWTDDDANGCCVPYEIEIVPESNFDWVFWITVTFRTGSDPYYTYHIITYQVRDTVELILSDFCEADTALSMDCWLYGQTVHASFYRTNYGACTTNWNGSYGVYLEAL